MRENVETNISPQQAETVGKKLVEQAEEVQQTVQRVENSESSENVPLLKETDSTTLFFIFDVKKEEIQVSESEKFGFETRNRLQRTGETNAFLPENQILRNREIVEEAVQVKEVYNEQPESSLGSAFP